MKPVRHITDAFAVSGAPAPEDFASLAAMGFKSVISNLPDGETKASPAGRHAAALARQSGLEYRYIPVTKSELFTDDFVTAMDDALHELPSPILAHCLSGQRSVVAWAAAMVRHQPVNSVLARLKAAGFDLEPLRDELIAQSEGA